MIDAERYIHLLLKQTFEALVEEETLAAAPSCTPDIDVDTMKNFPAVTWTLSTTGEQANGPGLWYYVLNLNVFGDGMDQAKALAVVVDGIGPRWDSDGAATVIEVDGSDVWLASVEYADDPLTRINTSMIPGRMTVQYSGSFGLALRG